MHSVTRLGEFSALPFADFTYVFTRPRNKLICISRMRDQLIESADPSSDQIWILKLRPSADFVGESFHLKTGNLKSINGCASLPISQ